MKQLGFVALALLLLAGVHATAVAAERLVLIEYFTNTG
jgi:hypothetical protein